MIPDQQYPFVKPHRHPNCLLVHIALGGRLSRRGRRAFFARMRIEVRRLGLVMGQKLGLCAFLGAERICTSAHRRQIVGWLIDQPEVEQVAVGELEHLGDVVKRSKRIADPEAWLAAAGALSEWIQYLQGGRE